MDGVLRLGDENVRLVMGLDEFQRRWLEKLQFQRSSVARLGRWLGKL